MANDHAQTAAFSRPAALLAAVFLASSALATEPVSFNRDIRPIMSDTCFHCHGNDAKTREAGMRLDVRDAALAETEGGVVPIVPGDPDASEIIKRIFDESDPMPPESAHKPLTPAQKELFRRWVAEGAVYEPHWAYAPLVRPALPADAAGKNPIDAFIEAKLAAKGLAPSPEAPPAVLERRLALDLTGLPPEAVLHGAAPRPTGDALVDALLASPHFGERMAVWWLDIARYADTVGFHGDQNQRIFPYRDYVIDAFNVNKPFDQFTREQLAGDLLPNPTTEQLVATGYNRLNMMTREGGAQPKEYLAKYGAERVRSVAAAWFGSTFGCAECHDHKFDPITARDFYELQAFFADMKQWGVYANYGYTPEPELDGVGNDSPFPPEIEVESPSLKRRLDRAQADLDRHLSDSAARLGGDPEAAAQAAWEAKVVPFLASHAEGWLAPAPVEARIVKDGKEVADRAPVVSPMQTVAADKPLGKGEALQIAYDTAELPAITAVRLTLDLAALEPDQRVKKLASSVTLALEVRDAAGKARKLPLRIGEAMAKRPEHRNGAEVPGLGQVWQLPRNAPADAPLAAVWLLDAPLVPAAGDRLVATVTGGGEIPFTLACSPLAAVQPLDVAAAADRAALAVPRDARSPAQAARATTVFLVSTGHDAAAATRAHVLAAQVRGLFGARTWTMVTERRAEPLPVRVLPRGNWQDESGPVVLPATPSFLPARIESTADKRLSRLDLANWLVSDANPITPRAVMNRLWAMFFGTGLSAVVDDLGSQGELPTHPELLDWLACEFRDSGWDVKHMIRLIVTSRTYRQASSLQPAAAGDDAARIRLAYRLALNREPRDAELTSLTGFLTTQRDTFKAAPADAEKSLAVGLAPRPALDPIEHAAWTQLARVLLNTQEVITRY